MLRSMLGDVEERQDGVFHRASIATVLCYFPRRHDGHDVQNTAGQDNRIGRMNEFKPFENELKNNFITSAIRHHTS